MNIIDDKFIIEYFYMKSSPNKINSHKLRNIPNDIQQYIDNRFSDSLSLKETLMRIRYGIEKHPLCPICNKPVMFFGHSKEDMFHNTCCIEHRNIYRTQCIKNAVNAKYGVDNVFQLESTKEKIKCTNLERYGVTSCLQNKDILEKSKQTCLSKYGVTNAGGINTSLLKAQNTCLNRYGVQTCALPISLF